MLHDIDNSASASNHLDSELNHNKPEFQEVEQEITPQIDPQTARINELEQQLAATKDQLLRTFAESENVRKRAERDRQDASQYAITQFARDLLSVADNLNRALIAMEQNTTPEVKTLLEGVEMTEKELVKVLEKHHIKKLYPLHEAFDPKFHQAMFEVDHDQHDAGTITEILQAGYILNDRLLRPAMVGVVKG